MWLTGECVWIRTVWLIGLSTPVKLKPDADHHLLYSLMFTLTLMWLKVCFVRDSSHKEAFIWKGKSHHLSSGTGRWGLGVRTKEKRGFLEDSLADYGLQISKNGFYLETWMFSLVRQCFILYPLPILETLGNVGIVGIHPGWDSRHSQGTHSHFSSHREPIVMFWEEVGSKLGSMWKSTQTVV